jgi:hypothetical protein
MKKNKIIFWVATSIIILFDGLMPLLFSQTKLAKDSLLRLGYPLYFGNALVIFRVLGCLAIGIPKIPQRIKEWAYAGFAFEFIFASLSHYKVDGLGLLALFPLVILSILAVSYIYYHRLRAWSPHHAAHSARFAYHKSFSTF